MFRPDDIISRHQIQCLWPSLTASYRTIYTVICSLPVTWKYRGTARCFGMDYTASRQGHQFRLVNKTL